MKELKVEIPEGMRNIIGEELESPETREFLREGVEEKLKTLVLFRVVDNLLKESELTEEEHEELAEEYRERLASKHGLG